MKCEGYILLIPRLCTSASGVRAYGSDQQGWSKFLNNSGCFFYGLFIFIFFPYFIFFCFLLFFLFFFSGSLRFIFFASICFLNGFHCFLFMFFFSILFYITHVNFLQYTLYIFLYTCNNFLIRVEHLPNTWCAFFNIYVWLPFRIIVKHFQINVEYFSELYKTYFILRKHFFKLY